MKLPKEGTNELSKDGFDWIALNVIFKGSKGLEKVKFGCFATFCQFSHKRSDNFYLCLHANIQLLGMSTCKHSAPWGDIDQLSRDGFHWIIRRVILKVGRVRFGPFSHNYWYYSVVTKCCPNLVHHIASLLWNQSCPKIWKVWNYSKGHFQGQKGTFVIYFS